MTCEVSAKRAVLERAIISHGYSSREAREAARELAGLVLSRGVGTLRAGSRGLDLVRGQQLQGPYGGLVRMVAIKEGRSRGDPVVVVTREELQRAARTLAHKPIDIDHLLFPIPIATMFEEISEAYATKWGIDVTSWCGVVLDAEEIDGAVEAIASITDRAVMGLIGEGAFRGVSVVEWARSESCTSGSGSTVCERKGIHFTAATLCLELEPAFEGTFVEPLRGNRPDLLQRIKARSAIDLTLDHRIPPPTAIIGPEPEEGKRCDHSELIALLDVRVPERVPGYFLSDLRRRLEREVSLCSHADVLALLDRPWPMVVSGELVSELLASIRNRLAQSSGLNSPGAKEVVACACT